MLRKRPQKENETGMMSRQKPRKKSRKKSWEGLVLGLAPGLLTSLVLGFLGGCSHGPELVVLDLTHGPLIVDDLGGNLAPLDLPEDETETVTAQDSSLYLADLKEYLSGLEKAVAATPEDQKLVAPVLGVLRAQIAEIEGNQPAAAELWRTALRSAPGQGRIGKMVFDSWARYIARNAAAGTDAVQLARAVLATVGGGRDSQYMLTHDLLTEGDLARRLYQFAPERLSLGNNGGVGVTDAGARENLNASLNASANDSAMPPSAPPTYGPKNSEDPLMFGILRQACAARLPDQIAAWQAWAKPLKQPWRGYWAGVMADCGRHHGSAVEAFSGAITFLDEGDVNEEDDVASGALRLELTSRLIKVRRALGDRETLGPDYENLMAAWQGRLVSAKAMGLHPAAFMLRRIDDTIWAARQKALANTTENNLEGAEALAREALGLANKAFPDTAFVAANYRRDLANLRCEALHFLAFRIAYERREWSQAAILTEDALQTLPITPEWTRRLQSQAVIYDFAAGQMALARKRLEQLLSEATDDSTRAFSLFWLARVFEQTGQKTESDFYLRSLVQEQPLSYYSVVAASAAGLLPADAWLQNFGDLEKLRGRLAKINLPEAADQAFIAGSKSNWYQARRLAEILVKNRSVGRWARAAVADAAETAAKVSRPDRSPEVFLYLSRLAYSAGDYARTIELTTALSSSLPGFWTRYPEQLFLVYPFPRFKMFSGAANTGGRVTLMLGLARQESSFQAEAQSAARAFGYMQLTPATARRLLGDRAPANDDVIETMLMNPQTSIMLSARYLEILNQRFNGSEMLMAAAYNAGEHAVSGWRKQREVEDQALFIEGIPYGETKGYVKAVLRNAAVYRRLLPLTRESLVGNKKDP